MTRLCEAAASMIRASRAVALRQLALGRGKLAAGWATLDALIGATRQLHADAPYCRASKVLGDLRVCRYDGPGSVDAPRVALPEVEPHFDLAPFLVDADVRPGRQLTISTADVGLWSSASRPGQWVIVMPHLSLKARTLSCCGSLS